MANIKKTQLLTLSLIATLLSLTPLFSSSFRSTYLYFIINVLIVVLGAEAGLLSPSSTTTTTSSSSLSKTNHEVDNNKKLSTTMINTKEGTTTTTTKNNNARIVRVVEEDNNNKNVTKERVFEKSVSEKIIVCANEVQKMIKKCPSSPSIFFIGEDEDEVDRVEEKVVELVHDEEEYDYDNENNEDEDDKEELFVKAETFIVNFYKQLKMQREESWKKIHGFNANGILVN